MLKKAPKRQKEYWDNVLHDHGLGMGTGRSSIIDGVGHTKELALEEIKQELKKTKKVRPRGRGPE